MDTRGRTVLVTGGATGIGAGLADRFLSRGCRVIVCGRREEVLLDFKSSRPGVETIRCDVGHPEGRSELFEKVTRLYPDTDVLVNNAGVQQHPPLLREPQDWEAHAQEIRINVDAPLHLSMLFAQRFVAAGRGTIVNVTSGLAFAPLVYVPTYSATKAALHSFTVSLRVQTEGTGVDVIEVAPPAVDTDLGGPGKHTFGVPVPEFCDHVMARLDAGDVEFGYGTSETARLASREGREAAVRMMAEKMAGMFGGK